MDVNPGRNRSSCTASPPSVACNQHVPQNRPEGAGFFIGTASAANVASRYSRYLRRFLSNHIPPFNRVLLVESGSRQLFEDLLPGLYEIYGETMRLDLVTCYAGIPKTFREEQGDVYRTGEYQGAAGRTRLYSVLRNNGYSVMGIICSAEPILAKWKWMLVWKVPAKLFILNENGDYFWVDRGQWKTVRHFALYRAGLSGAGAVATLFRLAMFPLTLTYLLLFAAAAHLRRKARA